VPRAEQGVHLLSGDGVAGGEAVDPGQAGPDPLAGGLAAFGVVARQTDVALLRGVQRRDLPGQVVIPRPGRQLVHAHHTPTRAAPTPRGSLGAGQPAVDSRTSPLRCKRCVADDLVCSRVGGRRSSAVHRACPRMAAGILTGGVSWAGRRGEAGPGRAFAGCGRRLVQGATDGTGGDVPLDTVRLSLLLCDKPLPGPAEGVSFHVYCAIRV